MPMNITSNLLQLSCTHGPENVNKIYQYLLIITQGKNTSLNTQSKIYIISKLFSLFDS